MKSFPNEGRYVRVLWETTNKAGGGVKNGLKIAGPLLVILNIA